MVLAENGIGKLPLMIQTHEIGLCWELLLLMRHLMNIAETIRKVGHIVPGMVIHIMVEPRHIVINI